ncbi:hypothetical protein E3T54_02805 [Cryobacterium sp. Sr8]|uniref:hypothetical protein n=1 Tax=Cryobacterium sp. Sr8 TaxID=1259203 RepID=UPI00106B0D14|nr:hypothetical protein [Cryobacterium sp. Sr8]TFD80689.1 hypothetical protein E3T54_02805 [Cryobacterium sp. Sr8]
MTSPIHTIRNILGMRPDHATEALDHLEVAENVSSDGVRNEHLTKALIHSNLALVEALTRNRRVEGWAGMEGNE